MLRENDRNHYLALMGITSWVPRKQLINAPDPILNPEFEGKESIDHVMDSNAGADQAFVQTAPSVQSAPSAMGASVSIPDETLSNAERQAQSNEQAAQQQKKQSIEGLSMAKSSLKDQSLPEPPPARVIDSSLSLEDLPRFSLEFIAFDSGLLICSEGQMDDAQRKLILQIQRAFSGQLMTIRFNNPFKWPMVESPAFDQSLPVAQKAIEAHKSKLVERYQPKCIMLLGESAAKWFGDWSAVHSGSLPVVQGPSVSAMIASPHENKKQLWQALKPHCL